LESAREAMHAEAERLEHEPPKRMPGVPQRVFFGELAGRWMLIETALAGQPVYAHLRPDTLRALALAAADWLAALAGRPAPAPRDEWWARLAAPVLADFERNFQPVAAPERLAATRALLDALGELPLVCEHGDFEPWNVRRAADGALVVLDWETAELQGLPAVDLVYFLTYLVLSMGDALDSPEATRTAYRGLINPNTPAGALFAESLARYAQQVGLAPETLRPLRRFTWLMHSRWEFQDLAHDAGHAPDRELLRRSLFFQLWEEDCDQA
ncbi:MAG: phosphotransferase, partial [Anaerolineales bacterium]